MVGKSGEQVRTVEAEARRAEQIIKSLEGVRTAGGRNAALQVVDGIFVAAEPGEEPLPDGSIERAAGNRAEPFEHAIDFVPRISGEPFVGSFARQRNLEPFVAHLTREQHQRRARCVGHRRFRRDQQTLIVRDDIFRTAWHDVRVGVQMLGNERRLRGLVEFRIADLGRERRRSRTEDVPCHRHDGAGIHSAAQIRGNWNVGAKTALARLHRECFRTRRRELSRSGRVPPFRFRESPSTSRYAR